MRCFVSVLLLGLPAPLLAWDFTARPICALSQSSDAIETVVTYDPTLGEYAIAITVPEPGWPEGAVFGIRFEGVRPGLITTDRHELTDDGRTLTVRDSGFGNVLDGMAFNDLAVARTGDMSHLISLDGAAGPVADFRACLAAPVA